MTFIIKRNQMPTNHINTVLETNLTGFVGLAMMLLFWPHLLNQRAQ